MPIEMSNKIILITEKTRITSPIKIALNTHGLEIAAEYPALTTIPVMRTGIAKSGKTAFIRTEILRFIRENGFPRAIIMDSQIDIASDTMPDRDTLKIFKTFLIAYIILRKGVEHKNLRGNFILLTKGAAFEKKFGIGANPHNAMNLLTTQNPEINLFLEELRNNREHFNEIFSIILLDTDLSSDIITDTVEKFLASTANGAPAETSAAETEPAAETDAKKNGKDKESNGDREIPARVVYRIDAGAVYDDGEILTDLNEEHSSLKEREFYIIGAWSSKTELEVSKKIAEVLKKGINEQARFAYGDAITFNLDDRCFIDKNTALSLAQLFTKNLSNFKKIRITASAKNGDLIQKSRGYPMIRDIFTIGT